MLFLGGYLHFQVRGAYYSSSPVVGEVVVVGMITRCYSQHSNIRIVHADAVCWRDHRLVCPSGWPIMHQEQQSEGPRRRAVDEMLVAEMAATHIGCRDPGLRGQNHRVVSSATCVAGTRRSARDVESSRPRATLTCRLTSGCKFRKTSTWRLGCTKSSFQHWRSHYRTHRSRSCLTHSSQPMARNLAQRLLTDRSR